MLYDPPAPVRVTVIWIPSCHTAYPYPRPRTLPMPPALHLPVHYTYYGRQYCYYLYSAAYHVSPTNRHCTTRTIRIRIPLYPPTAPTASPDSECVSPASIGLGAYVLCKALTTNAFLVRPPRMPRRRACTSNRATAELTDARVMVDHERSLIVRTSIHGRCSRDVEMKGEGLRTGRPGWRRAGGYLE